MNNRNFWTVLGLASLSIALLALPGSSARKQVPGNNSQQHTRITVDQGQELREWNRIRQIDRGRRTSWG